MAQVKVRKGEDPMKAIRRFKRKVENEGIMRALKRKRYHMKPSAAKRLKRAEAAKRRRKTASRKRRNQ
tara:strand:- start:563 stop:766 length:204 start_codon:yes stop_codon:yes gene_type:complete